jgi:putative ATP-dependent DNA ligase
MSDLALTLKKEGHAVFEKYFEFEYLRVCDDVKDAPRGTVFFGEDTVYGYPHVGRILTLSQGLSQHFKEPFFAEEKVDGYNIRIFLMNDQPVAMTRGGFICPFTTDRLSDLLDLSIFDKMPDLIIFGEVAGPENPYNMESPPFVREDVQLFVFDLSLKNKNNFFLPKEKYDLIDRLGLPAVPAYGQFIPEDINKIKKVLLQLNEEGREGIVFKENSKKYHLAKFVTANSGLNDIAITSLFFQDVVPEYFSNRVAQISLFLEEMDMKITDEMRNKLGNAFLEGQKKAYDMYISNSKVYGTFHCRFRKKDSAYRMIERLKTLHPHGGIIRRSLKKKDEWWILEFDRIFQKTTGLFGYFLGGGLVFD